MSTNEKIHLVVEILSCRDLLAGDRTGLSDPYVKVKLGKKELHRTNHIMKTLNPVFDASSKSKFILDCQYQELVDAGGLELDIKDWDAGFRGNDRLGSVVIPPTDLLNPQEEKEYAITPPPGGTKYLKEQTDAGFVTISYRSAADNEVVCSPSKIFSGVFHKEEDTNGTKVLVDENAFPEDKDILIEIVSCRNLLAADKTGLSDPYVKVKVGTKDLHTTKHVLKSLNPAFSSDHNNALVLSNVRDMYLAGGLTFKVKDYDPGILGGNDELGAITVPSSTIYELNGEKEFHLSPPKGHGEDAGFITIRCRDATLGDKEDWKMRKSLIGKMVGKVDSHNNVAMPDDIMKCIDKEDKIFLLEIVSCRNLLASDKTGLSDPYVKIKYAGKTVHETKPIHRTVNPVFTKDTKNSYILDVPTMDLFQKQGLQLKVKDHDPLFSKNEGLGTVDVSADELYNFISEDSKEFKIDPPSGKSDDAGYLTLKCTILTESERDAHKRGLLSRLGIQAKSNSSSISSMPDGCDLTLLIEIVSCQNLPKADRNSSDPYVKVKMGSKDIHKTAVISKTCDPIYTIATGSLFIIHVNEKEFRENEVGLEFKVKDKDTVSKSDELGIVRVSGKALCDAAGERMPLPLDCADGSESLLNLRCRPATGYDLKFMEYAAQHKKDPNAGFLSVDKRLDILLKPKIRPSKTLLMKEKDHMEDNGIEKFRVRPNPDPARLAQTKWLSHDEIQSESLKPSAQWISIGSGDIGYVFVEVIGASGLPNLDKGLGSGKSDKTDAFCLLVCENCCAKTDIIDNCLNPRWLPWMQRAFRINLDHASSDLFLGIFDYDDGLSGDHDMIGRVPIELSGMVPNTEYLLTLPLHADSFSSERKSNGTITLRIRIEYSACRDVVLSSLKYPPPQPFINVKAKKDYKIIRKTMIGQTDYSAYSLSTLKLYIEELTSYLYVQYYLQDAVISLLFWRGQVPFLFGIKIPLHSAIAFYMAITMAENPYLAFSYFWLANAWLLLAIQTWRNNLPNVWFKTKSFSQIFRMLVLNMPLTSAEAIPANYRESEAVAYQEAMDVRIAKAGADAVKRNEEYMRLQAEHNEEMAALQGQEADTDISTQSSSISIDPLKKVLYPIQQLLASLCTVFRFARNVYLWDEPFFAFFYTLASFVIGLVFLVIPWGFFIRWVGRIVAWGIFGPHMKLVDIFYYSKLPSQTKEDVSKQIAQDLNTQRLRAKEVAQIAFEQTEDAQKLKAMKELLFGSWVVKIPVINTERFRDFPLFSSSATLYDKSLDDDLKIVKLGGQKLVGTMIPQLKEFDDKKRAITPLNKDKDI
eukprot:CAMPEP_0178902658 /NCGR_PEP_ID=MMETSP0786-20121207/4727_1 /TAXON_ID=186022 /ORGANISM="Thalassionema frauenfeldii, Strain CCMP 1798" /LENGTH=1315 /DNA_ID=CAMNT_0020573949 /DNA_START=59 /DNA_END=4006 /DNA_ORIENTATION=-